MNAVEPALDGAAQGPLALAELMASSSETFTRSRSMFQSKTKSPEPVMASARRSTSDSAPIETCPSEKRVLDRGKAEQHYDQHKAAGDGRLSNVVGDLPRNDHPGISQPGEIDHPGRDQKYGAVVATDR